jgi:MFS transporter, DHA1 family, inner membrane transport protein
LADIANDAYTALALLWIERRPMADAKTAAPPAETHVVHEAAGPAFSPVEAASAITVGVNSLLVLGVLPALLGALADEGRLTNSQIGLCAMLELLAMGISTGLCGLTRSPRRLKAIGLGASLALAAVDVAGMGTHGAVLLALRTAAGAIEGVLLWITIGFIVRTATPERWAGVFFTVQTAAQLVLALLLAVFVLSKYGADGGLLALGLASLAGVVPALTSPRAYEPLPIKPGEHGAPPPRGWAALVATMIFVAGGGAIGVYLQPLAHAAGLNADVARTALWTSLVGQVAGGALATVMAGRVRYFVVFVVGSALTLVIWTIMGLNIPAWVFVADNVASGVVSLVLAPFIAPMTIAADPTRRAGVQSGAAQLLGGAFGPLLSSVVVGDGPVRGVLWLGAGLLLAGLAIIAWLRLTARGEPA